MINEKYIELMNKSIDNLISDEEKIRLEYYLAENKEAKGYFDELLLTGKYLNEMTDPVPSESLKKRIVNSIDFSRYSPSTFHNQSHKLRRIFNFKYAVTFAVGLLAGIFIYSLFVLNSENINTNEISGTMATTENAVTIEEIPLNFPGITGKIEMKAQEKNFWFSIKSNSVKPVDFIISYPEQVQFENIKPENSGNLSISSGIDYIKTTISGSQNFNIMFKSNTLTTSPIHLELLQSGNKIDEFEFSLKR